MRTTNPYGSVLGRPDVVCTPMPGSRPVKSPDVTGNMAFRAATSTAATCPSRRCLRDVVPSHHVDFTCLKSPGGTSVVFSLFGNEPGATRTRHVYDLPRLS